MNNTLLKGGTTTYGQIVGILMTESTIPRLPGDPGHAATFPFPVRYGVIKNFPFTDLIEARRDNLDKVIDTALQLQGDGVRFVAADCGLFSLFQREIADALEIPFLGSALSLIPLIHSFLPAHKKIGVITGDTQILKEEHLTVTGARLADLVISGLDDSEEFQRVVVNRGNTLDPTALERDIIQTAEALFTQSDSIGAILLECTNLIPFRRELQERFNLPVFDMVSLIEFFASGYRLRRFEPHFL